MPSERIGRLLDELPQLQNLNREARQLLALQHALAGALPDEPLLRSTAIVRSADGAMVLFADNGAVAAKLRHLAPRLLVFFRQRGVEVTGIRVQVQPSIRPNPLPRKQISLGPQARHAISRLSSKLPESPLRVALARLAASPKAKSDDQR